MTHFEVVKYLVKHGADINKPNYNGGTCLINSVQSAVLCEFLLKHGADVNAKDIQNKTALHYAIQEHRLETTKLLLKYGANHNAVSRYGDDALQMACLKGATRIFEYLTINVYYSPEQLANAHELMGATFLDEHNDLTVCLNHWKQALRIRQENELLPKQPQLTPHEGYRNQKEFESLEELESVSTDLDAVRIQSLLIAERILGAHHKDTIFRLMYRGASYADVVRYQRCIELWRRALQLRIEKDTILYTDTCFTAQALIRLMVDYKIKSVQNKINNTQQRFHDILETFKLLTSNAADVKPLLSIRPQYKRQLEFFEKMVKCITHLIYLMVETIETPENREIVKNLVKDVLRKDIRCVGVGDTILHLCLSRLNTIKSSYFADEEPTVILCSYATQIVFPHLGVLEVLLESNAVVNAKNESGWTPLHVATKAYNFDNDVVKLLLKYGAHLDQPDSQSRTPLESISDLVRHHVADLSLINYTSLKCLCASLIVQNKIPYSGQIPKTLENFVKLHEP
ncbi:ankyrin repeat protein mann-cup isoform X1 [Rhynchophorus ferrugineus]|uniref:ankyrin repeat protein mann-cup isoform X1 n=1 Tax=Rhynchophorus ferrugineus TaxID=354439 RepID=UPI003FCDF02F